MEPKTWVPGPALEKVSGEFRWGSNRIDQRHCSFQVVLPPESPSCEKRVVMETGRWLMLSTWLGLR